MTDSPPMFDCKRRRHKVITADRICVLCGARGVVDARRLPPLTTHDELLELDTEPTTRNHP